MSFLQTFATLHDLIRRGGNKRPIPEKAWEKLIVFVFMNFPFNTLLVECGSDPCELWLDGLRERISFNGKCFLFSHKPRMNDLRRASLNPLARLVLWDGEQSEVGMRIAVPS